MERLVFLWWYAQDLTSTIANFVYWSQFLWGRLSVSTKMKKDYTPVVIPEARRHPLYLSPVIS